MPDVAAPKIQRTGPEATLSAKAGEIYFTVDGSDPRLPGGEVSSSARKSTGTVALEARQSLRARTRIDGDWSGLVEAAAQ